METHNTTDSRNARRERGQAVTEFALVLPLLAAMVLVFISFGKALYYYLELTHVANEGARLMTVNPTTLPLGSPSVGAYLCSQFGSNSELFKGSGAVTPAAVTISYPGGASTTGNPVQVDVSTSYSWFPFMNLGTITIKGSATMRLEQDTSIAAPPVTCS